MDAYVAVDASGTFSKTKRHVGLLRMLHAGVILSDYATLMVEILKDNARPEAGEVYGTMDMPWAKSWVRSPTPTGRNSPPVQQSGKVGRRLPAGQHQGSGCGPWNHGCVSGIR